MAGINRNRTALVIGGSGQIGSRLIPELAAAGYEPRGTYWKNPAPGLWPLDLSSPDAVEEAIAGFKPGLCVLSAAMTHVDRCEDEPELARKINAEAPGRAAKVCRALGARLCLLSTEYVFDGAAGPYDERAKPSPLSVYGRTKLAGEERVLEESPRNLVARTTVVFSWSPGGNNFIMQLRQSLGAGRAMRVAADQVSTPTYAPDLAKALARLLVLEDSGIWNLAGPDLLGRCDFALQACRALGLPESLVEPVATKDLQQRAPRPLQAGLATGKLRARLGPAIRGAREALEDIRRLAPRPTPAAARIIGESRRPRAS